MAIPNMTANYAWVGGVLTAQVGSIAWDAFNIKYGDVSYQINAGSTADRWVWWRYNAGSPSIEAGANIPTDLTDDDLVLFGNKEGTPVRVQSATLVDGELIVDGSILAKALNAKAVTTEHLLADNALVNGLLQVKQTISEAVETEGLTIAGNQTWNATTGFTIPEVVNFPPTNAEEAYVWAKLIARSLTIEDFFKLRGRTNEFSAGGKVVLADAISPPDGPPVQEAAWEQVTQLSVPEGAGNLRGIVREDAATNTWVALLINLGTSGNDCQLVRFVNGVETKRSPIMTYTDGYGGICRSSSGYYYVCSNPSWYDNVSQGGVNAESFWTIEVVTPDLNTKWGMYQPNSRQVGFSDPGIRFTSDDTQIYAYSSSKIMIAGRVAGSIDRLHGLTWDASNPVGRADSVSITLSDRIPPNESFQGLTKGKPPGNDQLTSAPVSAGWWTAWYGSVDPFLNGASIPSVQRAYGKSVRGAWHDGTYHYTLDSAGKVYRYEKAQLTGQVGFTWRDTVGTQHETTVSPPATISVPRGAGVLVTPDPPPFTGDAESPDVSQVFARVASGDPWRDHGPGTPTKFIGVINGAATVHGAIATFAAAGISPFEFLSQKLGTDGLSLIGLFGSGKGRLGDLRWDNDGNIQSLPKYPAIRRSRSSDQTGLVSGSWTPILFNAQELIQGVEADGTPAIDYSAGVFTCRVAGLYSISAHGNFAGGGAAGDRQILRILKGTVEWARQDQVGAGVQSPNVHAHVPLAVGDTFSIEAYHNRGTSGTTVATLNGSTTIFYTAMSAVMVSG